MKKIFLFLAPMLIMTIAYGCSKDHEAPTFSKYGDLMKPPQKLIATYSKSKNQFDLTWQMPDTNSVKTYFVAWSDSNVFDLGKTADTFTDSVTTGYSPEKCAALLDATWVFKTMGYIAAKDSFIVYFTVSAVYNKYDENGKIQFDEFIGPRSVVDSALVYKK